LFQASDLRLHLGRDHDSAFHVVEDDVDRASNRAMDWDFDEASPTWVSGTQQGFDDLRLDVIPDRAPGLDPKSHLEASPKGDSDRGRRCGARFDLAGLDTGQE
jgi:hypothetical protein